MREKVIICVDDEKTILESLKSQLIRNFGDDFVYEFGENADEGFEIIEEFFKDNLDVLLIISDWLMPGMKGDDFLIEVKKRYPTIKSIMLTGQANQESINAAFEKAQLSTCIAKPWDEKNLIDAVKNSLNL